MNTTNKNSKDEFILEVTQEEYDEAMAKGWTDDDIQKPGKYLFRRATRTAKPEDLLPSNIKVDVALKVDLDVFEYFEQRGENYQAEMNKVLRAEMERIPKKEKTAKEIAEKVEELIEA